MFILIIIFKMVLKKKYKKNIILDLLLIIIFEPCLQIINVDRLINKYNHFKITIAPIYSNHIVINLKCIIFSLKVKFIGNSKSTY